MGLPNRMGFGLKESLPRAKTGHGLRVKEAPSEGNIRTAPDIDWGWVLTLGVPLILLICFLTGILNVDRIAPVSETMSEGFNGLQSFGGLLMTIGVVAMVIFVFKGIVTAIESEI